MRAGDLYWVAGDGGVLALLTLCWPCSGVYGRREAMWGCRTPRCGRPGARSACGPTRPRSRKARCSSCATSPTLPWVKGLAVMPDVHYGKGATVGSVIAMQRRGLPGGGRGGHRLRHDRGEDLADRRRPAGRPVAAPRRGSSRRSRSGCGMHDEPVDPAALHGFPTAGWDGLLGAVRRLSRRRSSSGRSGRTKQMGTLGGGNHFIEVCLDDRRLRSG